MKFAIKNKIAAAALVAIGSAHASVQTLDVGETLAVNDYKAFNLTGESKWTLSSTFLAALNAMKERLSNVDPATTSIGYKTNTVTKIVSISAASMAAPVTTLSGDFAPGGIAVHTVGTAGGVYGYAPIANVGTTGGAWSITNLNIDLTQKRVYADLTGTNIAEPQSHVYLWDVALVEGASNLDLTGRKMDGSVFTGSTTFKLTGLSLNPEAVATFSQLLGLTRSGQRALQTVTDFGSIVSTVSVSAVPEPEATASAVVGLGVVGIALAARRRRAS